MPYVPITFVDEPSETTPIDAASLNHIQDGIVANEAALQELSLAVGGGEAVRTTLDATYFPNYQSGSAVGAQFSRIGNLVIANFSATLNTAEGNNLFLATIPEEIRPSIVIPFQAVFVPTGSTTYQSRMVILSPNGMINIANSPAETGTFFVAMVYFIF